MANELVIRKVMDSITDENFSMRSWVRIDPITGEWQACAAGRTLIVMGIPMRFAAVTEWIDDDAIPVDQAIESVSGRAIIAVARELWGITAQQARDIFHSDVDSVDDLWSLVTEVTGVTKS